MDMDESQQPSTREALFDPWMVEMLATNVPEGFDVVHMLDMGAEQKRTHQASDQPLRPGLAKSFSFAVPGDPPLLMSGAYVYYDDETGILTAKDPREPSGIPRWMPYDI